MTEHHEHSPHPSAKPDRHDHEHADHDDHAGHDHGSQSLNRLSVQAVLHCMTGCAIGEVVGMVIATALGWGNVASIALSVSLAFVFGYALTSIPLFKAGLVLAVVVPLALATDTASIAIMELVDNLTVVAIPSAMDADLDDALFWASLLGGFVVAFPFAFVVNRWLLQRGKGHALVHAYHQH
jgi:putative flippase GtrA